MILQKTNEKSQQNFSLTFLFTFRFNWFNVIVKIKCNLLSCWTHFSNIFFFFLLPFTECKLPRNKIPYTNGTHFCIHCDDYYANTTLLKWAYSCGCGRWADFYNGCCYAPGKPGSESCHLNTVKPIYVNKPPPSHVVVSHGKYSANENNNKKTGDTTIPKNYDKVIWAGTVVLFLTLIAALVKIYLYVRTNPPVRDHKMNEYRLDGAVTSLDMNALIGQEV